MWLVSIWEEIRMQHPQDNHIRTQREGDVFSARQEASEVTKPADTLNLNVQSPKHCKNRFLFSEPHGLCYFVMSTKELTTSHCGAGEDSQRLCLVDSKIKPVNPKGNQPWIFIGRTDAEAPILWPPDAKCWLIGKDPDSGTDWRQEKGVTEVEMVEWYHWLNGHEFEQTLGDGEGQGSLACCSPWGHGVGHDWATEQHQQLCCRSPSKLIDQLIYLVNNHL